MTECCTPSKQLYAVSTHAPLYTETTLRIPPSHRISYRTFRCALYCTFSPYSFATSSTLTKEKSQPDASVQRSDRLDTLPRAQSGVQRVQSIVPPFPHTSAHYLPLKPTVANQIHPRSPRASVTSAPPAQCPHTRSPRLIQTPSSHSIWLQCTPTPPFHTAITTRHFSVCVQILPSGPTVSTANSRPHACVSTNPPPPPSPPHPLHIRRPTPRIVTMTTSLCRLTIAAAPQAIRLSNPGPTVNTTQAQL